MDIDNDYERDISEAALEENSNEVHGVQLLFDMQRNEITIRKWEIVMRYIYLLSLIFAGNIWT
jgi:hypothetical protein